MKTTGFKLWLLTLVSLLTLGGAARAAVKPNNLIADGAVLQQGIDVPIWGTATDGEKITVKFQDQAVSTVAKNGRWLVKLKPLKPGGPFTMTITGTNVIEVKDLLVGEVWICSGQSNMAFQLYGAENGKAAIAASDDPLLRLCTVNTTRGDEPQRDVPLTWRYLGKTGHGFANGFSAVGYFFGRDLRKALNVPVGLIHASVGATAIGWWMDSQTLDSLPPKMSQAISGELQNNKSVLYNGMIAPLQPYAIRGVIWNQGESDMGHTDYYQTMLPAMIKSWRAVWGQGDFPFLFAQALPNDRWSPELREAQLLVWQRTTNTAMTVNTDCGDPTEIHPPKKEPLGVRFALAARAIAYGEKIEYSGPIYDSLQIAGDRIILKFQHIGTGLMAKDGELKGFTVAGADGKFVKADAKIVGATVVVSSKAVPAPTAARYGWANTPDVNFCNKEGLLASPFRTDRPVVK